MQMEYEFTHGVVDKLIAAAGYTMLPNLSYDIPMNKH